MTILEVLDRLPTGTRLVERDHAWALERLREACVVIPDEFDYTLEPIAGGRLGIFVVGRGERKLMYVAETVA